MLRHLGYHLQRLAIPAVVAIRFRPAGPQAERGRVPPGLLADCADVAAEFAIDSGRVEAVRGLHGLTLRFAPTIPASSHQRFRNVFGVHLAGRR
jgi:hypothetical protein